MGTCCKEEMQRMIFAVLEPYDPSQTRVVEEVEGGFENSNLEIGEDPTQFVKIHFTEFEQQDKVFTMLQFIDVTKQV